MSSTQNIVLSVSQYNELTSFVNNAKNNLEQLNSILSTIKVTNENVVSTKDETTVEEIVKNNEQSNINYDSSNPTIKSEKQWFICNSSGSRAPASDWISNRNSLLSQFDLNSSEFLNILEKTNSVVAGGFAVNCLFGFDLNNYNGDMDIFLTNKFWKNDDINEDMKLIICYLSKEGYNITLDSWFKPHDLGQYSGVIQKCPKEYEKNERIINAYKTLNKISRIVVFSKTINGVQKDIQVIFTEYDCVRSHIRTFDMSICQTFFDHKNLYTRYKYHQLTLNKVNVLLKKNVDIFEDIKYLKRINKYQSRGFKTFDLEQKPFVEIKSLKLTNENVVSTKDETTDYRVSTGISVENEVSLVKDSVKYLEDKIEKKIEIMISVYNIRNDEINFTTRTLLLYTQELFGWLKNPLRLFENTERIGNPFKHKYTDLFVVYVDILQFKLNTYNNSLTDDVNCTNIQAEIQRIIQSSFMNYVFENIKDIRWLLSLMLVYPDLFKFTDSHYKAAINKNVARDNLYLIKKELKQNV